MAKALPSPYGMLDITLVANTVLRLDLLPGSSKPLISIQPDTGVLCSYSWEGTDGATGAPTNKFGAPVADQPIARGTNGLYVSAIYLWSSAGGVIHVQQTARV
jgi:hypothetical protein